MGSCLGKPCSRSLIVCLSQLFWHLVDFLWLLLENSLLKSCDESLVRVGTLYCAAGYNYSHQHCKKVGFPKNCVFISLLDQSRTENHSQVKWAQNWNLSTKIRQNLQFLSTLPATLYCHTKRENLRFFQCVNFEFMDSFENNDTTYFLIFDDSCEEICNSKAFVDIATAGRYRQLSTVYIRHNFFQQSKVGRDVELQNTHSVHFNSPRASLSPDLLDWYRDATSVPSGHLWIDLSPRTDD